MPRLSDISGTGLQVLKRQGGCATCPRKLVDFVPATRTGDSVIWVGEAPGATEAETGEGFVGKSGTMMRQVAQNHGLIIRDVSNTIHCRPPNNKTPTAREVQCCMAQHTIEDVRGYPYVVLVGSVPLQAFFPGVDAGKMRGNFLVHPDFPGQRFYPIHHPAHVLRSPRYEKMFSEHIERLGRVVRGEPKPFRVVTPGDEDFDALFEEALGSRRLGLDIESNRKPAWSAEARVTSIAVSKDPSVVLACHEQWPAFTYVMDRVTRWLQVQGHQVVGHQIGFDIDYLERLYQFVNRAWTLDTMALAYQLHGWQEISLKELASREGDGYRTLVPWTDKERDPAVLEEYNGEDTYHTLTVFDKMFRALPPQTRDLYVQVASRQSLAYQRMQSAGVVLLVERWKETQQEVAQALDAALKAWRDADPQFRPDYVSGQALQDYLFVKKSLPVLETTPKGAPQVDERVIKQLIESHGAEYLQNLLTWRQLEKQRSTYIDPLPKLVDSDGRIHPRYVFTSTDTGRRSCREPNYQNQPRLDLIRRMWGPRTGWRFMQADYSQIELRIGVSLANSVPAIQDYNRGIDLHMRTARYMTGKEHPTKEERSQAKPVNFGLLYGGSAEGLRDYAKYQYGIEFTLDQARTFLKLFFREVVPGLDAWHSREREAFEKNRGQLMQVVGHQHWYPDWDAPNDSARGHAFRSYLNAQCQGPAGYITSYTTILAQQWMMEAQLEAHIVGEVHDSLHVEVSPKDFSLAYGFVRQAVDHVEQWCQPWLKVPLEMDYEVGDSWGSLEKLAKAS